MITFKQMDTRAEWEWFKERTHVILQEDTTAIVALDEQGIAGVVAFDTFTLRSCNVHMAVERSSCIRAGLFTEVAVYGFHTCSKDRFFGLVPSNNEKALKLNQNIGFTIVTEVPDALDDGVGYTVMRLDKADCRFLPGELREAA
jgi:hypothetical protein